MGARRIAPLIVDWTAIGTTPDSEDVNIQGTATEWRDADDGIWRYVIGNPSGTVTQMP